MTNTAGLSEQIQAAADLHNAGRLDDAAAAYEAILRTHPDQPDVLHFLGVLQRQRAAHGEAIRLIKRSLAVAPGRPQAHYDLGAALSAAADYGEALPHLIQAAQQMPESFDAHLMLGLTLRELKRRTESLAPLQRAISLSPGHATAHWALCASLQQIGDVAGLFEAATRALEKIPEQAEFQVYRSEALFALGRLPEAWDAYDHRFKVKDNPVIERGLTQPRWRGEDLRDRKLAVWSEQGVGDIVMYASMIPDVIRAGARCRLEVPRRFHALFRRSFPEVEVLEPGDTAFPGDIDFQSPIASLGRWLRSSFDQFPPAGGYLKPDRQLVGELRQRYLGGKPGFLVGIAWRSSKAPNEVEKSIPLNQWGAILGVPGLTFVSLQYGDVDRELAAAASGFGVNVVHDRSIEPLGDLDAFSAQIAAMDIVISSGSAAAHIAGALGVPTICMLPRTGGRGRRWYWFAERAICPWYPSVVRLVERDDGNWTYVIAQAAIRVVAAAHDSGAFEKPTQFLISLADSYRKAGLIQEQLAVLRASFQYPPFDPRIAIRISELLVEQGSLAAASEHLSDAVAKIEDVPELWNRLGIVLDDMDQCAAATSAYRRALKLDPSAYKIMSNLGTALRRQGRGAEAAETYKAALLFAPNIPSILLNLAACLFEVGRMAESLATFERLLKVDPENAEGHYSYAQALLANGCFEEGWREFQWRWRRTEANVLPSLFPARLWDGDDLSGRSVLTYTEQGVGDEILIAGLIDDLRAVAGRVVLLCTERLLKLMRRSFPDVIVEHRVAPLPLAAVDPRLDVQMSLSELGARFRKSFADFRPRGAYLRADLELTAEFRRSYLQRRPSNVLVGISWRSGNPGIGTRKSSSLAAWIPLLKVPGVTFIDLQYGDTQHERQAALADAGVDLLHDDSVDLLGDLDRAAAQIAALDLVISVSNTAVHLAGSLGIPTWALIDRGRGRLWYWFRDRSPSPWYNSVDLVESLVDDSPAPDGELVDRLAAFIEQRRAAGVL